jgi:adenylate cyclase
MTLLEIGQAAGVPHAAVCGGRGRCSTCRVRILRGQEHLAEPAPGERRVLERIRADPAVRLACQVRPTGPLAVVRLVPPRGGGAHVLRPMEPGRGREAEIVILFADLRGFTRLAEGRLPYDTVYLLNRYFREMGEAIEGAGGRVDKFIGDGVMALFGLAHPPAAAAAQALAAARAMAHRLEALNAELAHDLPAPLRIGIGVHLGPVIVGEMGHGPATSLTAIGDAVNVASRLEAMTKELGVQLVVSASVTAAAGVTLEGASRHEVELRGRHGRLGVLGLADATRLATAGHGREAAAQP